MGQIEDIQAQATAANSKLDILTPVVVQANTTLIDVNLKLDEVAENIQNLINQGGGAGLQQILDDLIAANGKIDNLQVGIEQAAAEAGAVLAEADTLDGTP